MKALLRAARRGLGKNRARTWVTVAGVALSAALITAVATFAVSLQSYMVKGAMGKYGGWHAAIMNVTTDFIEEQAADGRVAAIAGWQNTGYADLGNGRNPDKPYLFLAGFDEDTFDAVPVTVFAGRLPENDGEVLIPAHLASDGGVRYAVGDTITLEIGTREAAGEPLSQADPFRAGGERLTGKTRKSYVVVGICQRLFVEPRSAPGYTLVTRAGGGGTDSRTAFVTLKNPMGVKAYVKSAASGNSFILNDEVLRFMGLSEDRLFNALLFAAGGVLVALVVIGSVFLIYNAFNLSLGERVRQFGILMSVGATRRQLRASVLFEGLCIGAMGIPIGILAGLPAIGLVLQMAEKNFANLLYGGVPLSLVVSAPALAAAAGISLITILISAWIPARRAAGMPVMACILQTDAVRAEEKAVATSPVVERLWGFNGTLALKSFRRSRRRCRGVILSLTLSVVLIVAADSFGIYLKQVSDRAYIYTNYDIALSAPELDDAMLAELFSILRQTDGVTGGNRQELRDYEVRADARLLTDAYWQAENRTPSGTETMTAEVQFLNDEAYHALLDACGLAEDGRWFAIGKVLTETGGPMEVGDVPDLFRTSRARLTLEPAEGEGMNVDVMFVDIEPPDATPVTRDLDQTAFLTVLAPWSARPRFPAGGLRARGLTFTADTPGQTAERMRETLDGLGLTGDCILLNVHEMLDQSRNITFIARLFSAIFITLISLIAAANVFNTISTNIRLRGRELAMLRSVGQSDRDFSRMMHFECALYTARTMLWGLPLSALASIGIWAAMNEDGLRFAVPWRSAALSALGVAVVVSFAMRRATGRLMRENIIDALRDDMT